MSKKYITFILSFFFLTVSTIADNIFNIETSFVTIKDTGKFHIILENDVAVNGANVIIQYDPALIKPLEIKLAERILSLNGPDANTYDGDKISFLLFDQTGSFLDADSGKIFEVTYMVADTALGSDTTTQVTFFQGIVADENLAAIPFEYVDGEIHIQGPTGTGEDEKKPIIPKQFALGQNYPNPFNPSTTIPFAVPLKSRITVKLYNVLGQQVNVLLKKQAFEPGWHELFFDYSQYASGVYFYRIEAQPFSRGEKRFIDTKKMVLIK